MFRAALAHLSHLSRSAGPPYSHENADPGGAHASSSWRRLPRRRRAPGDALVVGYGRMGRFHARVLGELGYQVTSVDPDPRAGAGLLELPERDFDVAAIATPVGLLPDMSRQVARLTRRLLVEKPVAASLVEVERLEQELRHHRVCVGFVERFNPWVLRLRAQLADADVVAAKFVRWNDRPSDDVRIDLRIHDVDLALWLGVRFPVYDTRAGMPVKRRTITATDVDGYELRADLMDHRESPLDGLWRAFLAGHDYPTLADAVAAHRALDVLERALEA